MPWSRSTQVVSGVPEVDSVEQCTSLLKEDFLILFKHSPTCPVSWTAHREVVQLLKEHPDLPLHLISVRNRRDVSRFVADQTGIEHESPQVIIFRGGKPVGDASHNEVTADFILKAAGVNA